MTAIPLAVNGTAISVLIVGGGRVATRKALSLLGAGAGVRLIAPEITDELGALSARYARLSIFRREYAGPPDIANAVLVIAATASTEVNARVAADAHAAHRLVNVVDAPGSGSFTTMAVHRAGDVVIGVSAGNVPSAAARIRDRIALQIDQRYGAAVAACSALREQMLTRERASTSGNTDSGAKGEWADVNSRLIGRNFCESVEGGTFATTLAACR